MCARDPLCGSAWSMCKTLLFCTRKSVARSCNCLEVMWYAQTPKHYQIRTYINTWTLAHRNLHKEKLAQKKLQSTCTEHLHKALAAEQHALSSFHTTFAQRFLPDRLAQSACAKLARQKMLSGHPPSSLHVSSGKGERLAHSRTRDIKQKGQTHYYTHSRGQPPARFL